MIARVEAHSDGELPSFQSQSRFPIEVSAAFIYDIMAIIKEEEDSFRPKWITLNFNQFPTSLIRPRGRDYEKKNRDTSCDETRRLWRTWKIRCTPRPAAIHALGYLTLHLQIMGDRYFCHKLFDSPRTRSAINPLVPKLHYSALLPSVSICLERNILRVTMLQRIFQNKGICIFALYFLLQATTRVRCLRNS